MDAPWYLIDALASASGVLSLYEMPEEYAPPVEIFHHPERLKQHFDAIHRKSGGGSGEEILHDPSVDVSAAAEYRKKWNLPEA